MNRTQYLLARLEWKRDYVEAQQQIRDCKAAIREAHRALGACGLYRYGSTSEDREHNTRWRVAYNQVVDSIQSLYNARKDMEDHLKRLWDLKEIARQEWLKRQGA